MAILQETAINIIKTIISSNFKELERIRIKFVFEKGSDYYMAVQWNIFYYVLFIDVEILNFSRPAFKGCLGHELAHILEMEKLKVFKRLKEKFTRKSKAEQVEEERRTDLLVIQHGLGQELLQFHIEHNQEYKSYKKHEGLTKWDIKKILKTLNK